ncbi:hypothetical protein DV735_g4012, partial [Chaetothyriales sp. CBS 134920]
MTSASLANPPRQPCIPMSESDIPKPAYRQPAELTHHREKNGHIDQEILNVHIFGHPTDPSPRNNGDWFICVPTNLFEKAVDLVRANQSFEPFAVADVDFSVQLQTVFPRFRFLGLNLFFRIVPGKLYLLDVRPENIERSYTGLPYPRLAHLAQGLLDTFNGVDLEDLVDGMNLSMEWGDDNLDLEGPVSAEWAIWKANTIAGGKALPDDIPMYAENPPSRRDVWSDLLDPDKKRRRMGFKYPPEIYETRFRLKGSRDPRSYKRAWI